jgi:hypothetical protein
MEFRDMSEPKFTPGPWSVDEDGLISAGGIAVASVYDADDFPCLDADDDEPVNDAAHANACLIAAAPDLLDACKDALELCRCTNGVVRVERYDAASDEMDYSHTEPCPKCAPIRRAILKAEGGAA